MSMKLQGCHGFQRGLVNVFLSGLVASLLTLSASAQDFSYHGPAQTITTNLSYSGPQLSQTADLTAKLDVLIARPEQTLPAALSPDAVYFDSRGNAIVIPPMPPDPPPRRAQEMQNMGRKSVVTPTKQANSMKVWRVQPSLEWFPGMKKPKAKVISVKSPRHQSQSGNKPMQSELHDSKRKGADRAGGK